MALTVGGLRHCTFRNFFFLRVPLYEQAPAFFFFFFHYSAVFNMLHVNMYGLFEMMFIVKGNLRPSPLVCIYL